MNVPLRVVYIADKVISSWWYINRYKTKNRSRKKATGVNDVGGWIVIYKKKIRFELEFYFNTMISTMVNERLSNINDVETLISHSCDQDRLLIKMQSKLLFYFSLNFNEHQPLKLFRFSVKIYERILCTKCLAFGGDIMSSEMKS